MGVVRVLKVTTNIRDNGAGNMKDLMNRLKKAKTAFVTVGVHESAGKYTEGKNPPEVAEVALWNEFGTQSIPERSFMRSAIDGNEGLINKWRVELMEKVIHQGWTAEKALSALGFRVQTLIQNKIKSNVPPPNALSTQRRKALSGVIPKKVKGGGEVGLNAQLIKSSTLINSGLLLRSITYQVHA